MKRSWFRFHLSTLWLVALVASVLVWANITPKIYVRSASTNSAWRADFGWPALAQNANWYGKEEYTAVPDIGEFRFVYLGMAINLFCCFGILAAVARFCEYRLKSCIVRPRFFPCLTETILVITFASLLSVSLYFIYCSPITIAKGEYFYPQGWPCYSYYCDETSGGVVGYADIQNLGFGLLCLMVAYFCSEFFVRRYGRSRSSQ